MLRRYNFCARNPLFLTFFLIPDVTFPVFPYLKVESRTKKRIIMTYIIQNRIVQILYNDRDFNDQLKRMLFPSQRDEHQKPITVIRL